MEQVNEASSAKQSTAKRVSRVDGASKKSKCTTTEPLSKVSGMSKRTYRASEWPVKTAVICK